MADKLDKYRGSLVGGAVGDALGYAVEFAVKHKYSVNTEKTA